MVSIVTKYTGTISFIIVDVVKFSVKRQLTYMPFVAVRGKAVK